MVHRRFANNRTEGTSLSVSSPRWQRTGWKPEHIFVPLDGSTESERILMWVGPLAKKLGSHVTFLGVLEQPGPDGYLKDMPRVADPAVLAQQAGIVAAAERGREKAVAYLSAAAARLAGSAASARTEIAFGNVGEKIAEAALAGGADMIAIATRRESTMARGLLGSATARVLEISQVPVLVVRLDEKRQAPVGDWPKNIVVPLDVSPLSETAVDPAISLAKAVGAKLRFLRVTPRVYYPGLGGDIHYAGASVWFGPELRAEAFQYLAPFVDRAISAGVDAYADVRSGNAASKITEALDELPDSMVVMTTHGRGGFQRWALGSVTDKVIRSSAQPVLALPAGHEG